MSSSVKPVAMAVGAAVAGSLMLTQSASAAGNPFSVTELQNGYMLPVLSWWNGDEKGSEGKCGDGRCGGAADKAGEGKCGAGKCGGAADKAGEGKCGAGKCGGTT